MTFKTGATTTSITTTTTADSASSTTLSTSKPSSCSPTPAALPTPSKNAPKPIKLRAACNQCFSAKVRCDGNKQGCRRCLEKRLSCVYSESRVGKVVGKRRKRPLPEQKGNVTSQPWIVNGTACPVQSIPSPAASHGSEDPPKAHHCSAPSWSTSSSSSTFSATPDQGLMTFDETTETLNAIEMANNRSFSMTSEVSFFTNNGLPTPALSPPQFVRYLSPAHLDNRPTLKQELSVPIDPRRLCPPGHSAPFSTRQHVGGPSLFPSEDEETVCIKLLAHLKRHSSDEYQPRETQLELLKKSNAAVRRLLQSKTIRSAYTCHLLLSNILNHLVRLCERLCQNTTEESRHLSLESQFLQDQVHFDTIPGFFENGGAMAAVPQSVQAPDQVTVKLLGGEVMSFASTVGNMLKRKPLDGFQTLGKHETFHAELELRLVKAMDLLQSS
ncbi:uncharacterized protein PV06_10416 [Exophiala oligosperma]|uniref:Zn(2)-C6 fungal-type domain-containing protein n=1 Tax=Exophiala oligosperma TaxID=215243 RepID=A0A0D2BIZ0_9EURO|nr:uncharacterized protein PV06_10416 [Exophiala oligosperma]KIW37372.1 hypothetical protein PV06_10416 [Exophiala oligosperma]